MGDTDMGTKMTVTVHFVDLSSAAGFPSVTEIQEALLDKFYWLMVDVIKDD